MLVQQKELLIEKGQLVFEICNQYLAESQKLLTIRRCATVKGVRKRQFFSQQTLLLMKKTDNKREEQPIIGLEE